MKTYIVSFEPFPHGMAATNRILHYGKGLVSAGDECLVVVGQRTEFIGRNRNLDSKGEYQSVPFIYPSGYIYRSKSFIKRRIDDIMDTIKLLHYLFFNIKKRDTILLFTTKICVSFILQIICSIKKVKIIRELCEFPFATRNENFFNCIKQYFFEKILLPKFDGVIAISQNLKEYALQFIPEEKIIKIPILIDTSEYDNIVPYKHERPYIFHGGTMYERKDAIVSTMKGYVEAMKSLCDPVDFILAGPESPHKDELIKILSENDLILRVHFIGQLKHDQVLAYQKGAILSILNKNDNVQNRHGFSTKLGDILLAETPVITTTVGEANIFLEDGKSAFITEPHNPILIAQQIVRALSNEDLRVSVGLGGKHVAIESFDYKKQGVILSAFFKNL